MTDSFHADVTQWVEFLPSKQAVAGSNPVVRSLLRPVEWFCMIDVCTYVWAGSSEHVRAHPGYVAQ